MSSKFYSPLRYPGGKSCIFPFVSQFFYENDFIGIDYAEPYAGGAGLALRLLFEGYVNNIHINDYDPAIYALWKTILFQSDDFCNWIEDVDIDIKNWIYYKERQSDYSQNSFELAKSVFFLNRTNVSGVIKGGVIGGIKQLGKYKMHVRFNKKELISRIKKIASQKERIYLSNDDGICFLKKMNRKRNDIFIYLDPPYYQKGADLYMNFYVDRDHQELSAYVHKLKKKWMISYDKNDFILNLYSNDPKIVYQLSQCASNRVGDEVVIFSNNLAFSNSMQNLKSPLLL